MPARKILQTKMHYLLIGTELGLFTLVSRDRRGWKIQGHDIANRAVFTCAADLRGNAPVLYAGGNSVHWGPDIFRRSLDDAAWKEVKSRPRFRKESGGSVEEIWEVQPGPPENPELLYAGTAPAALFQSSDGGESWEELSGLSSHPTRRLWQPCRGGLCLHSIVIDPANPGHMLAGISAVGVFETEDGGKNWKLANDGLDEPGPASCVHKVTLGRDAILYQQNHHGVWKRGIRGAKWESVDEGLPSRFGFAVLAHPRKGGTVYVIPLESPEARAPRNGELQVHRSENAGKSWEALGRGLPYPAFVRVLRAALVADGANPCGLFFGTTGGSVYVSLDDGESWFEAIRNLPKIYALRAFQAP